MKKSLVLLCAQWAMADEGYAIQMQKSTSQLVDELGLRGLKLQQFTHIY